MTLVVSRLCDDVGGGGGRLSFGKLAGVAIGSSTWNGVEARVEGRGEPSACACVGVCDRPLDACAIATCTGAGGFALPLPFFLPARPLAADAAGGAWG